MSSRIEDRTQDDEMDNLDFEEISDEELDPEEAKTGIYCLYKFRKLILY